MSKSSFRGIGTFFVILKKRRHLTKFGFFTWF